VSEAEELAARLKPWNSGAIVERRLPGGTRSAVWAVSICGRRYVARQTRRSEEDLVWELDLLRHLKACGLRVPRPLAAGDGRDSVDGLFVLEWLDGVAPKTPTEWRQTAAALADLHAATRGWPQRPGFVSSIDLLDRTCGGDVDLAAVPGEVVRLLRSAWAPLVGLPMSVVHGDPHAGNLRVAEEGVGLLDWDEARVDVSLLDFSDLPPHAVPHLPGLPPDRLRAAGDAWEVAASWTLEPEYARRRLATLTERLGRLAT
jgi:Ser/Thr protein kinase RdoA (MazF antagonist)